MASMNGISIQSLCSFDTVEGVAWKGDMYLEGKKIGRWSNDDYGGPDSFWMEEGYSFEKLMKEISRRYPEWKDCPEEYFMFDLMRLTNREENYKNMLAELSCDMLLVVSDGGREIGVGLSGYSGISDQELLKKEKDYIDGLKKKLRPEDGYIRHKVSIYRGLEQFSIGEEEIKLADLVADV